MVNNCLFNEFMGECAFARLIFAKKCSQHMFNLWLPMSKKLRRAHLSLHLVHEYASQLPFNLKYYFIRCILIYLLDLSFTWIYEKFNKGIIPSLAWSVENRKLVQQVMSWVKNSWRPWSAPMTREMLGLLWPQNSHDYNHWHKPSWCTMAYVMPWRMPYAIKPESPEHPWMSPGGTEADSLQVRSDWDLTSLILLAGMTVA